MVFMLPVKKPISSPASIWRFAAACRANMLLKENVAVAIADARLLKDNMC